MLPVLYPRALAGVPWEEVEPRENSSGVTDPQHHLYFISIQRETLFTDFPQRQELSKSGY